MKSIGLIIIVIFCISFIFGMKTTAQQFPEINKDDFKLEHKDGYKDAMKNVKIGDDYYSAMEFIAYIKAIEFYELANEYNSRSAALNYKLGVSYLLSINKTKSIPYLDIAYEIDPNVTIDLEYMMARAYQLDYQFDKAIEYYEKFKLRIDKNIDMKNTHAKFIEKYIQECIYAKELEKMPARAFIDNMGEKINSMYRDHTPVITADESVLFFTSRRQGFSKDDVDPFDGDFYENIYVSYNEYGIWTEPKLVNKVSTKGQHDATISITPDGQHMFIYKSDNAQGDIFESKLKGDSWSSPKKMPRAVSSKYHETSACLSYDGSELFFTSNRPETTIGGSDIFVCTKNEKGEWANVKNIGDVINTEYDEESIFLMPDGKTIYFSSEGHNTIGGLDIFKSTRDENGRWTKPENLGMPINTPDHDVFFVLSADGRHGYYSTVRQDSYGSSDIYRIVFLAPEKALLCSNEDNLIASLAQPRKETLVQPKVQLSTVNLTVLKGVVRDKLNQKPLEASIEIIDNMDGKVVFSSVSNELTGNYLVTLPSGKNYGIRVNKTDYMFHSENFDIPQSSGYQEVIKDVDLMSIAVGAKIILRNVFFDFDKATLRPESKAELNKLTELMRTYPTLKIRISGHTDDRGSDDYNLKLSDDRSKSVVAYLTANGIDAGRLEYKGFGESQPMDTNDTEAGRQLNRRVEAEILSK